MIKGSHIRFVLLLLITQWFCLQELLAQTPLMWQLTDEDGLPSMTVYNIKHDAKGYTWIATSNGLCRYDGRKILINEFSELKGKEVVQIQEKSDGQIYFLTLEGEMGYVENNKVSRIKLENIKNRKLAYTYNLKWVNEQLWVMYSELGMIGYKEIVKDTFAINSVPGIRGSFYSYKGATYFFGRKYQNPLKQGYLFQFKENELVKVEWQTFNNYLLGNLPYVIELDTARFVAFQQPKKLHLIDHYNKSTKDIWPKDLNEDIKNFSCHESMIYILTRTGVYKYNIFNETLSKILDGFDANHLSFDQENNIWLGTNNGVFVIPQNRGEVITKGNSNISSNYIKSMYPVDGTNNILLGHDKSMISQFSTKTQKVKTTNFGNIGRVTSFLQLNEQRTVSTSDGQLFSFNHNSLQLDKKLLSNSAAKCLFKDSKNNVWVGTSGFIQRYPSNTDMTTRSTNPTNDTYRIGDRHHRTYAINEDNQGVIWIGTINGLFTYQDSLKAFLEDRTHQPYNVKCMARQNDILWVGTQSNGVLGIKDGEIIKRYNQASNAKITSDNCLSIVADANFLWLGTDGGVFQINTSTQQVDVFDKFDGLPSNEILSLLELDTMLFIGTPKGLVSIPKRQIKPNKTPPKVYLTGIQILDTDTSIFPYYQLLYNQNDFKIDFEGLAYRAQGKETYEYRLIGQDSTWITTESRTVQFRNLAPNEYTFEVKAVNEDGVKSTMPASFSFLISPPWWETIWFYSLLCISILSLIGLGVWLYIQRIRREQRFTEKVNELRTQALQSQMNPHFVFNALNAIQKFMTTNDAEPAMRYLTRFAKLIRMIFDMSKRQWVSLEKELEFLQLYIGLEKLRFEQKVNISLNVATQLQDQSDSLFIPPLLIQPIVENAFKHGLLHKKGVGQLEIDFKQQDDFIVVIVKDNGVGRKKSKEINQWKKEHVSSGITTTQERLQILNPNTDNQKDLLFVEDHYDSFGEAIGTSVKIYVPLKAEENSILST